MNTLIQKLLASLVLTGLVLCGANRVQADNEPADNTSGGATTFQINSQETGTMVPAGDVDWYKCTNSNNYKSITFSFEVAGADPDHVHAYIYGPNNSTTLIRQLHALGDTGFFDSHTIQNPPAGAEYYVRIDSLVLGVNTYTLDTAGTAVTVGQAQWASSPGNLHSQNSSVSSDGNFVAFESDATSLVANDFNGSTDIFVYDRIANTTERVSVPNPAGEGNDDSYQPSISADGRYVAFESDANTLVPNDFNGSTDIFVVDRGSPTTNANTIKRVSLGANGAPSNFDSFDPSISGDGAHVAFESSDGQLTSGRGTAETYVYIVNVSQAGTFSGIERIPVLPQFSGSQGTKCLDPAFSGDGGQVAFVLEGGTISKDIYRYPRGTNAYPNRITFHSNNNTKPTDPSISHDGARIAATLEFSSTGVSFTTQVNPLLAACTGCHSGSAPAGGYPLDGTPLENYYETLERVIVGDNTGASILLKKVSQQVSHPTLPYAAGSPQYNLIAQWIQEGAIFQGGKAVLAYNSAPPTELSRVDGAEGAAISGDGRFLAYSGYSPTSQIFREDIDSREPVQVSATSAGVDGNGNSFLPSLSMTGEFVAFQSRAGNLVAADNIDFEDIYLTQLVSPPKTTIDLSAKTVAGAGGFYDIQVTSNTTWSVSENESWVSVNPTGGSSGVTPVRVTAQANPLTSERTAALTIGGETHTLTQEGASAVTTLFPTSNLITSGLQNYTIQVTSNTTWSVSENASWVTVDQSSGSNNGSLMVTVQPNTATSSRFVSVSVGAATHLLTQAGAGAMTTIDRPFYNAASGGESYTINVTSNTNWVVNNPVSWVTTTRSGASVQVTVQPNPATIQRGATLLIGGQFHNLTQFGRVLRVLTTDSAAIASKTAQCKKLKAKLKKAKKTRNRAKIRKAKKKFIKCQRMLAALQIPR